MLTIVLVLLMDGFKAKESEADPLISLENGAVVNDVSPQKSPVWTSNKDLHA